MLHLLHTRTLNVIIYITKIPIECTNIFRISVSVSQLSTKISIGQLHKKYDWANVLHIHLSTDDFIRHRIHFPISHWPYTIQTILSRKRQIESSIHISFRTHKEARKTDWRAFMTIYVCSVCCTGAHFTFERITQLSYFCNFLQPHKMETQFRHCTTYRCMLMTRKMSIIC